MFVLYCKNTKEVQIMRCGNCGAELPDGEIYCRHCNRLNTKPSAKSKKRAEIISYIIVIVLLMAILLFNAAHGGKTDMRMLILPIFIICMRAKTRNKK